MGKEGSGHGFGKISCDAKQCCHIQWPQKSEGVKWEGRGGGVCVLITTATPHSGQERKVGELKELTSIVARCSGGILGLSTSLG